MLYVRRHGTELYYRYVLSTPLTPLKVVNILASLSIEAHFKKSYGGRGLLNAYLVGHAVEKRIRTKSSPPPPYSPRFRGYKSPASGMVECCFSKYEKTCV